MSTRAHIRILGKGNAIYMYRHCDGRPNDLGKSIQRYLKRLKKWDEKRIISKLMQGRLRYWDRKGLFHRIEETSGLHGDEDYVYVIDVNGMTLSCFRHKLDETFEKCSIPEREIKIPLCT